MTFEKFVATRIECDDIGAAIHDSRWGGEPKAKGYLCCGTLYIEQVQPHWPEHARAAGRWYLTLERDEYITHDLPDLERKLYEFALATGYCD